MLKVLLPKFSFARHRIPLEFCKTPNFSASLQCQIHPAAVHDIEVHISGILFVISITGKETYIYLHFWDNTSKDEKSEFGEHHEPYGLPEEAASTCQTLRWFNKFWNCFFRYSCFDPSATSVCPRTWHWQHSIDAPSMPHTLL